MNPKIIVTANRLAAFALAEGFQFEVGASGYGAHVRVRKGGDTGTCSIDANGKIQAVRDGQRGVIIEFFKTAKEAIA